MESLLFEGSWSYKSREHEGSILEKLKGISGIAQVLAWDVARREALTAEEVYEKYKLEYIQESFDKTFQDSLDLLYAWQSLY